MSGFLSKITDAVGLTGRQEAGQNANRQLFQISDDLKNFKPIRVRSALGTGTIGPDGASLDLDPKLAAGYGSALDFFGNSLNQLNSFNEGDATAKTLALLRERRAPQFNSQLSDLESRLMQQGRLGLGTGARGDNPELAGFFGAESDADLNAQLVAGNEARTQRQGLLDSATSGLNLALSAGLPTQFMTGLFNMGALTTSRDIAAANVAAGGPALEMKGTTADKDNMLSFFGGSSSGLGKSIGSLFT